MPSDLSYAFRARVPVRFPPFPSVPRILRAPAAFFPGRAVAAPTAFSTPPATLSLGCGLRFWWRCGGVVVVEEGAE